MGIIENPLYAVINQPNATMQRLIRKLNLLDAVDEQSSSGKLDLIIQLPYTIKSEARRKQADRRTVIGFKVWYCVHRRYRACNTVKSSG